jgi:hypothetical protein
MMFGAGWRLMLHWFDSDEQEEEKGKKSKRQSWLI